MRQCLGFHLQVNLGIDMRGIKRDMTEPRSDGIDIHTCTQEMHGGRMPDSMGTDRLGTQRWDLLARFVCIMFDHRPDTKARQWVSGSVEKHRRIGATAVNEEVEHRDRRGPEWTIAHLVAFADEPHRWGPMQGERAHL